jgi:hypothetical protein
MAVVVAFAVRVAVVVDSGKGGGRHGCFVGGSVGGKGSGAGGRKGGGQCGHKGSGRGVLILTN